MVGAEPPLADTEDNEISVSTASRHVAAAALAAAAGAAVAAAAGGGGGGGGDDAPIGQATGPQGLPPFAGAATAAVYALSREYGYAGRAAAGLVQIEGVREH